MTLFSRSFVRKRVISFATTASMAVISLVMAHGPTSAHRIRQTMPIQYAADWQDNSDETAFLGENQTAMNKMMMDMTVKPSGDIDRDFAAMMIPHHQGAIDMAQAELRYGKNEQLRRIAQEIIVDQLQEIAAMNLALGDPLPPSAAAPTQPDATTGVADPHDHSAHDHSGMSHGAMQMPSNSKMK
jgi:hypothetical protein